MGDESYKAREPIMREERFDAVADYLRTGVLELGIAKVNIVFHGGEPTLMRPRDFRVLAGKLREALSPLCQLSLGIQTNGYHLSQDWEAALEEFKVSVGVSLDGPAKYNDRHRVTHKGRGSHAKIAATVKRLHQLESEGKISSIGVLSVLGRDAPIEDIFEHFAGDLDFHHIGFLLPDRSWDDPFEEGDSAEAYGDLLIRLFSRWVGSQDVSVREVTKVLRYFQTYEVAGEPPQDVFDKRTHVVVIQSTGEVNCDDSLIAALDWRQSQRSFSVHSSTLSEFVNDVGLVGLDDARASLPAVCTQCRWVKICGGGALENRFSKVRQFDNPSVYCLGLKKYFNHVAEYLVQHGYPADEIDRRLAIQGEREPTFAI